MHSDDVRGNPKMGEVMNSRGRDALPEACFLRIRGGKDGEIDREMASCNSC